MEKMTSQFFVDLPRASSKSQDPDVGSVLLFKGQIKRQQSEAISGAQQASREALHGGKRFACFTRQEILENVGALALATKSTTTLITLHCFRHEKQQLCDLATSASNPGPPHQRYTSECAHWQQKLSVTKQCFKRREKKRKKRKKRRGFTSPESYSPEPPTQVDR